ncbi:MAG: hypothetical protein OES32_02185 [Acidobacteriota bacterium]|nr:hypothetical protein [Acidobacteriota bacterium]MDH3522369.1 hypothetical protein [Acidobacteriota bacterium]
MKAAVAFATLVLGLTAGPQRIELLVAHGVDHVDVSLDGVVVERLTGAPWTAVCDLGPTLAPHHLQAVAYAADGAELGRASQWLNLPRPPAQAAILLDSDPETGRLAARLRTNSIVGAEPASVTVLFDGVPLPAADLDAIPLPPHDPEQLHYLRIDVQFGDGLSSTVERTFGGSFSDEVGAELTAVALELDEGAAEPGSRAAGWLRAGGRRLEVVDVVTGPASIMLVRDQGAQRDIDRMARRAGADFRYVAGLKRGTSLQIMPPVARRSPRTDMDMRLFQPSSPLTSRDGGIFWLLTRVRSPKISPASQRISDALAVAGVSVAAAGNRRAAVLLLGPEPADHSRFSAREAADFLAQLHVPVWIWSTAGEGDTPWGRAADASSMAQIETQARLLAKSLERQRIAWVRGIHPPMEITLGGGTDGVRLAGS